MKTGGERASLGEQTRIEWLSQPDPAGQRAGGAGRGPRATAAASCTESTRRTEVPLARRQLGLGNAAEPL